MNRNREYYYIKSDIVSRLGSEDPFGESEKQPTRASYAEAVIELGEKNPKVVVLDADVSKSIGTNNFAAKFPERSFNFGIAEQNMMAAAAGMASSGLIPFASTYAVFASMRALDMVRNSIHYPRLNVKIAASHSGITPGPDGVTHQGQEDLSILRAIANSTVIAPADPTSTRMAVAAAAEYDGPVYLSFTRDPVPVIYKDEFPFEIGKAVQVRDGLDVTIVANRDLVAHALAAAAVLEEKGVDVRVIDCHTLKPLDEEVILKAAEETGAIVTAENNVYFGGLGSAVAELLVENNPIPMQRIGVRDTFAESGPYLDLLDKYGLSAPHIALAVQEVLSRKQK
ncbi:Transketolase, C-terminal section (EC [Olavius algarvensis associated proteobacterium Delta 3]|nr:Transketolase, C-terminal section (EC [Olavius algarvensis associated proteobacterium Delta 3]CAB5084480.1 Transketolase, C-terminal section (EC [Olavius algarvensis associated proteobacterium Delta 3]